MLRRKLSVLCAGAALWSAFFTPPASAAGWPAQTVTILAPFAPGGTVDIVARVLAKQLSINAGQSFIVENRGGAGGTIATAMLAKARPDGSTVMIDHMGLTFSAALYPHLSYDTKRDVLPIAYIGATPNVLVVTNKLPVKSVKDFLDLARAKPDSVAYGSGGVGSAGHLPMALLGMTTEVKLQHVPYKGSGPALTDLASGQIQAMLLTIPAVMPFIRAGIVRPIATSGSKRSPALPNLPTIEESGVKGFEYTPWYGLFAPAGTPAATVQQMHDAVNKALSDPQVAKQLEQQGIEIQAMSRQQFVDIEQKDLVKWADTIKKLGIQM
jgi:tripartite-type tricarboxylate transporter receptor subunit TctC